MTDIVERLRNWTKPSCPFDGKNDLEPEDPCPVCGDLGTWDDPQAPSNCSTPRPILKEAADAITDMVFEANRWTRADVIRLAAGEMTAQEMRTAQAVARGIEASLKSIMERN